MAEIISHTEESFNQTVADTEQTAADRADEALMLGASPEDLQNILGADLVSNPIGPSEAPADNPIDFTSIETPPYVANVRAGRAAARAISTGGDPLNAFNNAMDTDPDQEAVEVAASAGMSAVVTATERLAAAGTLNIEAVEQVVQEDVLDVQDAVLGKYLAHIKTMDGGAAIPQEAAKNLAANMFMQETIGAIWEDMSKAGVTADIAGLIVVPDGAWNAAEMLKEFFPDAGFMERYFSSHEGILRLRTAVNALPPEQKIAVFSKISDLYREVDDNQLQQIFGLLEIFDAEEEGLFASAETTIKIDQALDRLTAGGAIIGGLSRLARLYKVGNTAKIAAATQDAEVAGQVTHAVTQSEEVAKAMGISKIDAAAGADPHSATMNALLDGVPENYSTVINKKWEDIDTRIAEATRVADTGIVLTEVEVGQKADKAIKALEKYEGVQNVKYTQEAKGLNMSFDVVGGDGELLTRGKDFRLPFTVNDITGGFNTQGLTFAGEILKDIASPNFLFGKDRNSLVQTFERINYASGKIKQRMNDTLVSAVKGLNKEELTTTQNWLRKGDQEGKVFSYQEIVNTQGHSEKVFEAYASTRRIMDQLFYLKNKEQRGKLVVEGMREATVGGQRVISKQYDDAGKAASAYNGTEFTHVAVEGSEALLTNSEDFKKLYGKGYKLVRARNSDEFFDIEGINVKWAMVKPTSTRDLPPIVFNQKIGYIPRALQDATFFVKQVTDVAVAGKAAPAKKLTALRYFDNQKDANKYIDQLEEAALAEGAPFDRNAFKVLGDNEIPRDVLDEDYINVAGGMYTSGRKTEGSVKFGLAGTEGELVDTFESIQTYFANIGNRLPLTEYRIGIQQRWIQHAKGMGFLSSDFAGSFADAKGALKLNSQDPKALTFLEASFEQIQHMSRVPSLSEQRWAGNMKDLSKTLENKGYDNLAKYAYKMKDTGPIDILKSATFNLMLGTFNVSQLLVQSFGATVALAINPVHAIKGAPRAMAYRALDMIKDPTARAAHVKVVEQRLGKLGEGFAEEYALWSKSGLFEGVLASNADHQALTKGMPVDAGVLRRLTDKSTYFYREGELVNSRVSFATAVQRYKDLHPGKPLDFQAVMTRAEQLRLNMNNANKATVQKNWLRLLTQFQAINGRYIEAYTTSNFSKAEKARLFFGQAALFGAASIPFMENSFGDFMSQIGLDPETATEGEIVALRRGFVGWTFSQVMGVQNDISGRVSLGNEFLEGILEGFTEPKQIPALLFGPSWTTVDKSMSIVQNMWASTHGVITADDVTKEDMLFAAEAVAKSIGELPSSLRNVMKGQYLFDSSIFTNKQGQPIFIEDTNLQTEIFQSLGFSATAANDYYTLNNMKRGREEALKHSSDLIINLYTKIATGDQRDHKRYSFAVRSVLSSIKDPRDQVKIMNQVKNKLRLGRDPKAKLIMDVLTEINSQFISDTALFLPSVQARLNKEGEE